MQDCVRCKNHSICRLEHRNLTEKCAFVNPTEEIPIIHGKAELEEHDKRVRNKAIDEFAERLTARIILISADSKVYKLINPNKEDIAEFNAYKNCIENVNSIAEQLKGEV